MIILHNTLYMTLYSSCTCIVICSKHHFFLLNLSSDHTAEISGKAAKIVDLASTMPLNPDLIRPSTFPKYEPEQIFDEEGNLMVGDLPLKKVEVKPTDVDAYLKEFEQHPILKLKVWCTQHCFFLSVL